MIALLISVSIGFSCPLYAVLMHAL